MLNFLKKWFFFNNARITSKFLISLKDNKKTITTIKQIKQNGKITIEVVQNPLIIKSL